jgi:hypothetical protein
MTFIISWKSHVSPPLGIATRFFQASLFLRTIFATSRHHFYVPYSCVLRHSFSSAINYSFSTNIYIPPKKKAAQALSEAYIKRASTNAFDDIIEGKGQGFSVLLHYKIWSPLS